MGQKLGDVGIGPFDFSGVGTEQDLAGLSSEGDLLVRQEFAQGQLDRRWLTRGMAELSQPVSQRRAWVAFECNFCTVTTKADG